MLDQTPTSPDPGRAMTAPRSMDIPTFMRTPLITDPAGFDIAMIGVPYDGAVTNRPGARHGPREIRNSSSMMRSIHHATRVNPYWLKPLQPAPDRGLPRTSPLTRDH